MNQSPRRGGSVSAYTQEGIQWQLNGCGMSGSCDTLHKIPFMPSTNWQFVLAHGFSNSASLLQVPAALCWNSANRRDINANVRLAALKFLSLSHERTQRRLRSGSPYAHHASLLTVTTNVPSGPRCHRRSICPSGSSRKKQQLGTAWDLHRPVSLSLSDSVGRVYAPLRVVHGRGTAPLAVPEH